MAPRNPRASGRVTPKGTSSKPSTPPASSPRQKAVAARRQVDRGVHGKGSAGPPPAAFRRSGHR